MANSSIYSPETDFSKESPLSSSLQTTCPIREKRHLIDSDARAKVFTLMAMEIFVYNGRFHASRSNWGCPFKECKENFLEATAFMKHIFECEKFSEERVFCNSCGRNDCFDFRQTKEKKLHRRLKNLVTQSCSSLRPSSRSPAHPGSPASATSQQSVHFVPSPASSHPCGTLEHYMPPFPDDPSYRNYPGPVATPSTNTRTEIEMDGTSRYFELPAVPPPQELLASSSFCPGRDASDSLVPGPMVSGPSRLREPPAEDLNNYLPFSDVSPSPSHAGVHSHSMNSSTTAFQPIGDAPKHSLYQPPSQSVVSSTASMVYPPWEPRLVHISTNLETPSFPQVPTQSPDWRYDPSAYVFPSGQEPSFSIPDVTSSLSLPSVMPNTPPSTGSPPEEAGVIRCSMCSYSPKGMNKASYRTYLKKHMAKHIGQEFNCYHCNRPFTRKDNLKTHLVKKTCYKGQERTKRRNSADESLQELKKLRQRS